MTRERKYKLEIYVPDEETLNRLKMLINVDCINHFQDFYELKGEFGNIEVIHDHCQIDNKIGG